MSVSEFEQALAVGVEQARRARSDGMHIVAAGEMGIGNTTSASCLAVLLAEVSLERAVGRGAGADDATLERKRRVVERSAARARQWMGENPRGAIAEVAGFARDLGILNGNVDYRDVVATQFSHLWGSA